MRTFRANILLITTGKDEWKFGTSGDLRQYHNIEIQEISREEFTDIKNLFNDVFRQE